MSKLTAKLTSAESRATAYYLTMFTTSGAATVYSGIWFADQGLDGNQIGIINALPVFVILMLNLLVGRVADRASDWRQVIVWGSVLAGLLSIGMFYAGDFWSIMLIWTLATVPNAVVAPVMEAATMRLTRRNGTDYGSIRVWGTIGYMAAIYLAGQVVAIFGGSVFIPLFVAFGLLRGVVSLWLPRFRAPAEERTLVSTGASRLGEVMKPWFLLPLVGWSMVYGTHFIINAFQGLLWRDQGLSELTIGLLIALGAAAEAAMIYFFRHFKVRFSARMLILASSVVTVVRWVVMAFSPDVPLLIILQLLHSMTFALGFMGCVHFIANWTSEDVAAQAQSFFQMLQQAFSIMALLGFGWLIGTYGAMSYLAAAALAAVGAVLVWMSLKMMQPKQHAALARDDGK